MNERMTPDRALAAALASDDGQYGVLLRHGTLELGYYRPVGRDEQTPHERDELYVVQSGSGRFIRDGEEIGFGPGDALFAPAGLEHRFVEFSEDFATWVVFYGPPGGES